MILAIVTGSSIAHRDALLGTFLRHAGGKLILRSGQHICMTGIVSGFRPSPVWWSIEHRVLVRAISCRPARDAGGRMTHPSTR
jgi:hypothetical protein